MRGLLLGPDCSVTTLSVIPVPALMQVEAHHGIMLSWELAQSHSRAAASQANSAERPGGADPSLSQVSRGPDPQHRQPLMSLSLSGCWGAGFGEQIITSLQGLCGAEVHRHTEQVWIESLAL